MKILSFSISQFPTIKNSLFSEPKGFRSLCSGNTSSALGVLENDCFYVSASQIKSFVARDNVLHKNYFNKDLKLGILKGELATINSSSIRIQLIKRTFSYKGQEYDGIALPLLNVQGLFRLFKCGVKKRRSDSKKLKPFFFHADKEYMLLSDLISSKAFQLYYKYSFSVDAVDAFYPAFEHVVENLSQTHGKLYLPFYEACGLQLTCIKEDSLLYVYCRQDCLESRIIVANGHTDIASLSFLRPRTVYLSCMTGGNDPSIPHGYYVGCTRGSALARDNDKDVRASRFILVFSRKFLAPSWVSERALEAALHSMIAYHLVAIGDLDVYRVSVISSATTAGFSCSLTDAELVSLCLSEPSIYEHFDVLPASSLESLNAFARDLLDKPKPKRTRSTKE